MSTLIVLNRNPYDGTDVTWNALRLAEKLREDGEEVRLFLMNDSVDLARDMTKPPEGYFDLVEMTKDLISKGTLWNPQGEAILRRCAKIHDT